MKQIGRVLKLFLRADAGATAIEYSLVAALIAVALIGSITLLGDSLRNVFNSAASQLTKAM